MDLVKLIISYSFALQRTRDGQETTFQEPSQRYLGTWVSSKSYGYIVTS